MQVQPDDHSMKRVSLSGRVHSRSRAHGLSLLEIMVALAIAALLLLGVSQVFLGSKQAYSLQEGLSRAQENARFIFSQLESGLRMAGYFGCGSENAAGRKFYNHVVALGDPTPFDLRFERPIEGFQYTNCTAASCNTDNVQPTPGSAANQWVPTLPATLFSGLATARRPIAGSDVLVLRVLSAQSTPTLGAFSPQNGASFKVAEVPGDAGFVKGKEIYAITNCRPRVDIFRADPASAGTTFVSNGADNKFRCTPSDGTDSTWGCTQAESDFLQPPLGELPGTLNAEVHKAEYLAFYVGLRDDGSPALMVQKKPNTAGEELADGIESMHLTYRLADSDQILTANQIDALPAPAACASDAFPAECARDANWRKVVSVHIALLMRSQDRAGAQANVLGNKFKVADAVMTRPADGRFRDVYEITIALRNRLSGF